MPEQEIDLRDHNRPRERSADAGQRHVFRVQRYRGQMVEVEDVLFHLNSAVMMPDAPPDRPSGAATERGRVGGLAVLRAVLLHARDHAGSKLLIAGHTDGSGALALNLDLSEQRAAVVKAALLGEREAFADACAEQHRTEDTQQILRWVAQVTGWDCDPGSIDDRMGPLTRGAIERFQASHNEVNDASIGVDGIAGAQTYGAFFDLYEAELSAMLEFDEETLDSLRANIQLVSGGEEGVGCGPHHRISNARQQQYRSAADRRVELLFFEEAQVPPLDCHSGGSCDPSACVVYSRAAYRFEPIEVEPVPVRRWLSLQTVDELGARVGGIALRIEVEVGEPIEIESDENGFWGERIQADGQAEITLEDGTPVVLGTRGESLSESGEGEGSSDPTNRIDLRIASQAITDVIVPGLIDPEVLERARHLERRYGRIPVGERGSARGGAGSQREEATTADPRGADEAFTNAWVQERVADNLFLIASVEGAFDPAALRRRFAEWAADRHPELAARGFAFCMVRGRSVEMHASDGEHVGSFRLREGITLRGRIGAHSPFADYESMFADLASVTTTIMAMDGDENLGQIGLIDLVEESEEFATAIAGQVARRRVEVVYLAPGSDQQIAVFALYGGNGQLEAYSGSNVAGIHQRNLDLLDLCSQVYRGYIAQYVERVEACADEAELHALGPPRRFPTFPSPAGATSAQIVDLASAQDSSPLDAWRAIADKLNLLFDQRGDGAFYVKCEFEANTGNLGGAYTRAVFKWNFEADLDTGRVSRGSEQRAVAHVDWPERGGVSVLIDPATGEVSQKANLAVGPYGFEVQSNGTTKVSYGPIGAETNYRTQDTFLGAEFGIKDLVGRRWRQRNPGQADPGWLRDMPDAKCTVGVGFQGLRPGTVLNLVTRSPGFFQMRTVEQFLTVDWNTLFYDETSSLEELGWEQETWDRKRQLALDDYPESARKDYYDLTPQQKVALTQIPLRRFAADPYWKPFWRQLSTSRTG